MINQAIQGQVLQQAEQAGRGGDTVIAHMTIGEVVIPRPLMEDPEVAQTIQAIFDAYGENIAEFTVGDPANKINPETGQPEFGFFKSIKKVFKKIAPIALPILGSMIPGVGPVLGAALGGAAGGAIGGGGIKGALTGAVLGGAGGYLSAGAGGLGGILGKAPGAFGPATAAQVASAGGTNAALGSLAQGSGIRGILGGGGLSSLTSGSGGGNFGSLARIGGSLYTNKTDKDAQEEARQALLASTQNASELVQPYGQIGLQAQRKLSENLASGFNPGDLTSDPGYQFRLQQGQDSLNKQLATSGMLESGEALKAAQEYGQGMAATEYGNAYDRWLQQNKQLGGLGSQGLDVAGTQGVIGMEAGGVDALYAAQEAERKNKMIANILAGIGA